MNTANTKAVTVELITTYWASLISCPCQQDLPSAENYPYTCATSTFAGCKKYWTYLHVSVCVWHHVFFGNTSPVTCFGSHFLQVRYCDLKWFEHISISGQRCLWSAPYDMIKNVPPDAFFVHMTWYGSNLGLHKVGRLKMIYLSPKAIFPAVVSWGFSLFQFGIRTELSKWLESLLCSH